MAPTARALLAEVDRLPHPARITVLVRTGLDAAGTPGLAPLLDDLFARGPWERLVSLRVATAAGDLAHVRRCLGAGESALAACALGPGVRLGLGADELGDLLPTMSAALRGRLVRVLRDQHAQGLADVLLGPLREQFGDDEAAALLPGCSPGVVGRELASLAHAVRSWTAVARRHPAAFLDHVEQQLEVTPRSTWRALLGEVGPGLAEVAPQHADRVLGVLERAVRDAGRPASTDRVLALLARHDPARVRDLMLAPGQPDRRPTGHGGSQPMSRRLWRALAVLDDESLVRLARPLRPLELARVLRLLPPDRRAAVHLPLRDAHDLVPAARLPLLDLLPHEVRHAEAARLLTVRGVGDDPLWRLRLVARLPWAEAEPALREAVYGPTAEGRATAYSLLLGAAWSTRDPAVVESVLASLTRLRNEQEPVRVAALGLLATAPPGLLTDAAAGLVGDQLTAALQARDASGATRSAVQWTASRLVVAGLELDRDPLVAVGLRALEDAGGHLGHVGLRGGGWPRGSEQRVYDALLPRIRADERVGRHAVLLDLAETLGERAWPLADLQQRLALACRARDDDVVRRAVDLRLADPATRDDRVAEVLRGDASTITIPAVARAVATRRTDLLDAVLAGRQRGRFLPRGVRHVPAIAEHAGRWVPRQVDRYRRLLVDVVEDGRVSAWERASTLRLLGRVPGALEDVRRHLEDPTPQLADAALTAIAWTSEPGRVLGDLVAQAEGDRAHVAYAALNRCARFVAPADLAALIVPVLEGGKVTARKEVCRLLAHHRVPGALGLLTDVLARPGQHRDVRRAALVALRDLLDDEGSWTALEAAALDPELATALLGVDPVRLAPRHRERYALLLHEVALAEDPEIALPALEALVVWVRWDTAGRIVELATRTATGLDLPTSVLWRPALAVVLAATRLSTDPAPVLAVVDDLAAAHDARDLAPGSDAAAERDLPARQRLEHLTLVLGRAAAADPDAARTSNAVADRLAAHPLPLDLAVDLAAQVVPWEEATAARDQLLRVVDLCSRPTLAAAAAPRVREEQQRRSRLAEDALDAIVTALRDDARAAAALLALAVLAAAGDRGWTSVLREHLRALRRHPDPDVRLAAVRVLTVSE